MEIFVCFNGSRTTLNHEFTSDRDMLTYCTFRVARAARGYGFLGGSSRRSASFKMKESAYANVQMSAESDLLDSNSMEAPVPDMEHATAEVGYKTKNIHLSCTTGLFYFSN